MPEPIHSMKEYRERFFPGLRHNRFEQQAQEIAAMVMAGIDTTVASSSKEQAARLLERVRQILVNQYRWPRVSSNGHSQEEGP